MDDEAIPARFPRGLSYPVQHADLVATFRKASTTVDSLVLWSPDIDPRREKPEGRITLLQATCSAGKADLWVYAVPSERRAEIRSLLVTDGLSRALRWLAQIPSRGNAWLASRHEWQLSLLAELLVVEEREGAHWTAMRKS